tara:strand:- start:14138 stop:15064 length:927 start_codon:yes stop_codon:yes gene_type:complete
MTTDLTITEVTKKHAQNDYDLIKDVGLPHFRERVKDIMGVEIPEISKSELKARISDSYLTSTTAMFRDLGAKTLEIDGVQPSTVFDAYASEEGFFSGEAKKSQFPDAFIFECIKAEAKDDTPVIIVSNDGDFKKPVDEIENISLVSSLPDLFEFLGLQVDAPVLDEFFKIKEAELVEAVQNELDDWGLIGDVEESEVEDAAVSEVKVQDLTSFGSIEKGGAILVVARLSVKADVVYTHPNWDTAMYDSEDKTLYPWEDVSDETEVELSIDVSMSITVDKDGNPQEIGDLRFRSSNYLLVELHPFETYK